MSKNPKKGLDKEGDSRVNAPLRRVLIRGKTSVSGSASNSSIAQGRFDSSFLMKQRLAAAAQ